ncbi:MAG: ATP synthase F1 subunit delta [Acidobacteriota bacterium]|nr:ATP synthase F1 subunit delta [Acidobacteriota bacterium]
MTSSAIVTRYANALVDAVTAGSSGVDPAQAVRQLRSFEAVVHSSSDLRNVLASPAVSLARKRAVLTSLSEKLELPRILRNFLLVLNDHRRSGSISEVIDAFDILLDARLGFVRAEILSAQKLGEEQEKTLAAQLAQLTGKQVRMRFSEDPGLIGGVLARIGSTVYDGSVRGQLSAMARRLSAI